MDCFFQTFSTVNYNVLGISLLALLIMIFWPKVTHRISGSLMIIITIIVHLFNLPVDTIVTRFGEISSNLPSQSLLEFHLSDMKNLIAPATTIALMVNTCVHTQPLYAMTQAEIFDLYSEKNIHGNIDNALDRAREIIWLSKLVKPKDFIPTVKRNME